MKFSVREIRKEDIPLLHKFMCDAEIAAMVNYDKSLSYEEFKSRYDMYFDGHSDDLKIFALVLENIVIGKMEIGYDLENKTGMFEIVIGNKQLWRKGLAKKALNVLFSYGFETLKLNRISCEVFRFNQRSVWLMKRMKMQVEGLLRQAQMINDKPEDIYIFSILKKEYEGDV